MNGNCWCSPEQQKKVITVNNSTIVLALRLYTTHFFFFWCTVVYIPFRTESRSFVLGSCQDLLLHQDITIFKRLRLHQNNLNGSWCRLNNRWSVGRIDRFPPFYFYSQNKRKVVLAILSESNAVINVSVEPCVYVAKPAGKRARRRRRSAIWKVSTRKCRLSLSPPFLLLLLFWSYTVKSARVVVLLSSWKLSLVLSPLLQLTNATIY